jgi:hypothetical protein
MNRASPSHRQSEPCASPAPGRFYAYATDEGPCSGHKVPEAERFTDAAIGFLECWGPDDDAGQEDVSVTVIDCETGAEECFRIAVATGAMRPC